MKKLVIPVFLCLFCLFGCSGTRALPPKFDFTATCSAEDFTGEVTSSLEGLTEVKTVTPEKISGMTAKAGNNIVLVNFGGMEKSSEDHPVLKDLTASRIALMLEDISTADLNLSAEEDGKTAYTAHTASGDYTLVTDSAGNILALRDDRNQLTVRFSHLITQKTSLQP